MILTTHLCFFVASDNASISNNSTTDNFSSNIVESATGKAPLDDFQFRFFFM